MPPGCCRRLDAQQEFLPETVVWSMALQLCEAVRYLHANSVFHRDIKPANVMVGGGGRLKLVDLGAAKFMQDPLTATQLGTPLVGMLRAAAGCRRACQRPAARRPRSAAGPCPRVLCST